MTEKEQASFDDFVKSVKEAYEADKVTVEEIYNALATTYAKDEGYYSEEFNTNKATLESDYSNLMTEGKYQEASNKISEIEASYTTYIADKDAAEKAAAEEAAKKEAAEKDAADKAAKRESASSNSSNSSSSGSDSSSGSSSLDPVKQEFENKKKTCTRVEGPNGWIFYIDSNNVSQGCENIQASEIPASMQWLTDNGYTY